MMSRNICTEYDTCVVGAGMIGSSAAKYAAITGARTCLVGPDEPKSRKDVTIFGAYYDEGRITRSSDTDKFWAVLSANSVERYRLIEQQSGISFYDELGCLNIADKDSLFSKSLQENILQNKATTKKMDSTQCKSTFPYVYCGPNDIGIHESVDAGVVNPRKLVYAQQNIARMHGCQIIRQVVEQISSEATGDKVIYRLRLSGGTVIYSKKVLLATGAFTEFNNLLPPNVRPKYELKTQAVLFAEASETDMLKMKNMPCVRYRKEQIGVNYNCYILPPILYPDGKYYLKLGHNNQWEYTLKSAREVKEWYTNPTPKHVEDGLKNILHFVFPGFKPVSYKSDTCVTTTTGNRRPFIDLINSHLGVALAGNGYAAKSCDEIGKMAVELLENESWDESRISRDDCRFANGTLSAKL